MNENIKARIQSYYTSYYRDTLSLPDWERRVRFRENENDSRVAQLQALQTRLRLEFSDQKVLLAGCGAGGDILPFHQAGAIIYGFDPDREGVEIAQMRAKELSLDPSSYLIGVAERIPYASRSFDFVYCATVLEHVSSMGEALKEMIRVTKPGGNIYIMTPDYRTTLEPHYKIHMLPNLFPGAKQLNKLMLRLLGRSPRYLDWGVNYVNFVKIRKVLIHQPVIFYRTYWREPEAWAATKSKLSILPLFYWLFRIGIQHNIELLIYRYEET
jgi:2-polyprenyl-3-methyl-5-hydroxy-6-metoxy-1,4-benzoquinol methylase